MEGNASRTLFKTLSTQKRQSHCCWQKARKALSKQPAVVWVTDQVFLLQLAACHNTGQDYTLLPIWVCNGLLRRNATFTTVADSYGNGDCASSCKLSFKWILERIMQRWLFESTYKFMHQSKKIAVAVARDILTLQNVRACKQNGLSKAQTEHISKTEHKVNHVASLGSTTFCPYKLMRSDGTNQSNSSLNN